MKKRLKYFLTHLFFSLLIATVITIFIKIQWYPKPLLSAVGILDTFIIILAIQVVVWPFLSLLIYKENKKSLRFDLIIIIMLQIAFWLFSVYALAQGRPVWIVYTAERFELIRVNEIISTNIEDAGEEFRLVSWTGPKYVGTTLADSADERSNQLMQEVLGGISLAQRPERYTNINEIKTKIHNERKDLVELNNYNETSKVKEIIGNNADADGYIPLRAQRLDMSVLIDRSGNTIKIVDLRPW